MPNNPTYLKIRDVLNAAAKYSGDIKNLSEKLHDSSEHFVYFKRDKSGKVRKHPCAPSSIRRTIRFCIRLKLIESEESAVLTDRGNDARAKGKYDLVLQQAVLDYLQEEKLSVSTIENAINKLPFPDAKAIYSYLKPEIVEDTLRTCLALLAECGRDTKTNVFEPFQRKLYLTDQRRHSVGQ
jgi:hypothetical protein